MQAATDTVNQLERHLTLALPVREIESEVETRLKRLARTVKIHGFRPGKVPLRIVNQQYGPQVREEVLSDSVQRAFSDAVRRENLRVAGFPRLERRPAAEDQLEFTATFEVYPEVQPGSLAGRVFRRPVTDVSEADVDRTLEILRKQRVHYHQADRVAESGDQLTIDYVGRLDGELFEGGSGNGVKLVLGEGRFLPDFEASLPGMKAGEEKTFDVSFPSDYGAQNLAGKTAAFSVKVLEVGTPHVPELDAAFARTLGIADGNLETMRAEVRANLQREAKKRVQARVKDQVMQALVETTQLALPKSLVDMEIQRLAEAALQDMKSRGMSAKDVQLPPEIFRPQAERRVRLGLILAEVVKRHNLQAKPEQIRAVIEEHAQSFEQPAEMVRWYYQQKDRVAEVEAVVLEENVVQWVLGQGQVEDLPIPFAALVEPDKGA